MTKSRSRDNSPKLLYLTLGISIVLAIGYLVLRPYLTPSRADIFVLEPTPIQYGNTTVSGLLQKDSLVGEQGTYLLVLPDNRPIVLDIQGLDPMVGKRVTISGYLSPAKNSTSHMTMIVKSISLNK